MSGEVHDYLVGVFVAGSALAGLGSTGGCFLGALLVSLVAYYTGFLAQTTPFPRPAAAACLAVASRWLLWLGILFMLSVYLLPTGMVGKLHTWRTR